MRTLDIDDIHGCFTALITLLAEVNPAADDQLVFVGDYVDRGYESKAVLDFLTEKKAWRAVFLRGNHEVMMLEARDDPLKANNWQSYGGFETLLSYDAEYRPDWALAVPKAHWNFIERTVRFFETRTHI